MTGLKKVRTARDVQKKRKGFNFSRLFFHVSFFLFTGVIFYVLFFSRFLDVSSIEVNGNKYIEADEISGLIRAEISGKILWTIDKNNLLLARGGYMEKIILDRFKLARRAEIKKKFPSVLKVEIAERTPVMAFCEKRCFMLDENGQAYDVWESSKNIFEKYDLIRLTNGFERDINLGDSVLERDYMDYLLEVRKKVKERLGIEIERNFRTPTISSDDIRIKTKEGWEIYFNREIEVDRGIEILNALLKEKVEEFQKSDLEYVDLRINNKVFYKFRDGTDSEKARLETEKEREAESRTETKEEN